MLPALTFQPAAAAQERSTKWWKAPHQRAKRAEPSLPAPQQKLLRFLKAVCHPGKGSRDLASVRQNEKNIEGKSPSYGKGNWARGNGKCNKTNTTVTVVGKDFLLGGLAERQTPVGRRSVTSRWARYHAALRHTGYLFRGWSLSAAVVKGRIKLIDPVTFF